MSSTWSINQQEELQQKPELRGSTYSASKAALGDGASPGIFSSVAELVGLPTQLPTPPEEEQQQQEAQNAFDLSPRFKFREEEGERRFPLFLEERYWAQWLTEQRSQQGEHEESEGLAPACA